MGNAYENSIAMDYDGLNNIYVAGSCSYGISIDNDTLISGPYFLSKIDVNGNVTWLKKVGGFGYDLSANTNGDVFFCGAFYGTAIFATDTLVSNGGNDAFLAKYDSAGIVDWATNVGGTDGDFFSGIATDQTGDAYIAGHFFSNSLTVGGYVFSNPSSSIGNTSDILYIKYNSSGSIDWVKEVGGDKDDKNNGVVLDENTGSLYAVGTFESSYITFGSTTFTNSGIANPFNVLTDNLFLAKLSPEPLSIHEANLKSKIAVSPNPFSDEFSFSIETRPQGKENKIELIDILGNVVFETPISVQSGIIKIDVSPGVYLLRLLSDNQIYSSEKLVKIR